MIQRTISCSSSIALRNPSPPSPITIFSNSRSSSSAAAAPPCDLAACIASLQSFARRGSLAGGGRELHSWMLTSGLLASPQSVTSLINMYSKCGLIANALAVFHSPSPAGGSVGDHLNVYAWNAALCGLVSNGLPREAFDFYRRMKQAGVAPDKFTFPCVIKAATEVIELRKIHGEIFKRGLELNLFIGSALVNSCLKFGFLKDAHQLFDELPVRDVVLWNAMVNGYAKMGNFDMAFGAFKTMMEERIVPSTFTVTGVLSVLAAMGDLKFGRALHGFVIKMRYDLVISVSNALIDMYGKCKCLAGAVEIFDAMVENDIFSWNSIIAVHEHSGDHNGALQLLHRMLSVGVLPDSVTLTVILSACSHLAALRHGRELHGYLIVSGMGKDGDGRLTDDVFLNNAVTDMYAKCGSMRDADLVFRHMIDKDVTSWNIMITGYGMHGLSDKALVMFSQMCENEKQLKPDEVTFVGVLAACSHAGSVSQGREFLKQMESIYGVVPNIEHYTCVVDMLGRAGLLDEAYKVISKMPMEGNPVLWRAFLGACRFHGNTELVELAAEQVFKLDPNHCGNYVLMSNLYWQIGQYEEVLEVRHAMREMNVRKMPGCSWIELQSGVHAFRTADQSHPQASFIYAELNSLTARLHEHGYMPSVTM